MPRIPQASPDSLIVEEYAASYVLPNHIHGGTQTTHHRRKLRSNKNGVNQYRFNIQAFWDGGTFPEFELISGATRCYFSNVRESTRDGVAGFLFDLVFDFPPRQAGDLISIEWVRSEKIGASPSEPNWVDVIPTRDIRKIDITVRFRDNEVPGSIWATNGIVPDDRSLPHNRHDVVRPTETGEYGRSWDRPRMGLSYGISWSWDA